jgi:hypothetical protein
MKKTYIILAISAVLIIAIFLSYQNNNPPTPALNNTTSTNSTDLKQLETTVQAFLMSTLGTLSNGNINLEMAVELTTPQFAEQLTSISAIPVIYGIQQGPDNININKPQIIGNVAIIDVDGLWGGEVMQAWTFKLTLDSADIWRINNITPAE